MKENLSASDIVVERIAKKEEFNSYTDAELLKFLVDQKGVKLEELDDFTHEELVNKAIEVA